MAVDMTVGHEEVEPAVVVHVEETHAPAEIASVDAKAGEVGAIFKGSVAEGTVKASVAFRYPSRLCMDA